MGSVKDAKKAAALEACIRLHKMGELDDHLLPIRGIVNEEDVGYLFKHYPNIREEKVGIASNRRLHKIEVIEL